MSPTKRLDWLDVAKGIGVILVILGHLHFAKIRPYLYAFHLPLFFFLSGFVFKTYDSSKIFVQKKIKSLLIPYFWLFVLQFVFYLLYTVGWSEITWDFVREKLLGFLAQRRFWTIWFLTCLFLVNLIFYLIVRFVKQPLWQALVIFALATVSLTFYAFGGKSWYWNLDAALTALPFFYLGYQFRLLQLPIVSVKNWRCWLWLLGLAALCAGTNILSRRLTGQGLEMFSSRYGFPPLVYLSAVAGIGGTVIFSQFFTSQSLRYLGRHSLVIFACHQKIAFPLAESWLRHISILGEVRSLPFQLTEFFLTLILMTLLSYAIEFSLAWLHHWRDRRH